MFFFVQCERSVYNACRCDDVLAAASTLVPILRSTPVRYLVHVLVLIALPPPHFSAPLQPHTGRCHATAAAIGARLERRVKKKKGLREPQGGGAIRA